MVGRVVAPGRDGGTDGRWFARSVRDHVRAHGRVGGRRSGRTADLTLEGTGSLAIEQNDGTNAEIMSRLDVPFGREVMERYVGVVVSPLCMSISPLAQHRGVVFWSVRVCLFCLPASNYALIIYGRPPGPVRRRGVYKQE